MLHVENRINFIHDIGDKDDIERMWQVKKVARHSSFKLTQQML